MLNIDCVKETFDAADSAAIFCDIVTTGVIIKKIVFIVSELEFIIGIISGNIIGIVHYIYTGLFRCAQRSFTVGSILCVYK
jgi:hypothetical protein